MQAAAREHIDAATTPYPDSIMEPLSLSPTLATTFPHVSEAAPSLLPSPSSSPCAPFCHRNCGLLANEVPDSFQLDQALLAVDAAG